MKVFLLYFILALTAVSCINQKFLKSGQVVFKVDKTNGGNAKITAGTLGKKRVAVTLTDSAGIVMLTPKDTARPFLSPTIVQAQFSPDDKYALLAAKRVYYFPEINYPMVGDSSSNHLFIGPEKLRYAVDNFVLQAVTTPLKIRPAYRKARRLKDSLNIQALAELNVGLSLGFKRTWGTYQAQPYSSGEVARLLSVSGSVFDSIGGTNNKPITTRYYRPYEKTEMAFSYGGMIMFGFNNLNLGLSVGADRLFNRTVGDRWIYDGNLWFGISLSYDLVK